MHIAHDGNYKLFFLEIHRGMLDRYHNPLHYEAVFLEVFSNVLQHNPMWPMLDLKGKFIWELPPQDVIF